MYDIEMGEIFVSRDVIFHEEVFPYIIQKEAGTDACTQIFFDSGIVDDVDVAISAVQLEQLHLDADGAAQLVEQPDPNMKLPSSNGRHMCRPSEFPS